MKGSVKEMNMFHNYETEKITRKANHAADSRIYRVVRLFRQRSSCRMHLMLFSERPPLYDDLGWKNQTTPHNCRLSATSLAL